MCTAPTVDRSRSNIKRYYVDNNKITNSMIANNDTNVDNSSFERQNVSDVILHNIEIQFALYQFYVMYSDVENKNEHSNNTIHCQICYPKEENNLSNSKLSVLLSIFDSLIVDYKNNKTIVLGQFSKLSSKTRIYDTYKELYTKSLLNPFVISFLNKTEEYKMQDISHCIYQYQPCEDDMKTIVLNNEELFFIDFINQQLALSDNHLIFYCLGWSAHDVETSTTMKKLKKYFKKIFFFSTSEEFSSQYLVINNQ